jgi:hypothetical protein
MTVVVCFMLFCIIIVTGAISGTYWYGRLRPGRVDAASMGVFRNLQFLPLVLLFLYAVILYPSWHRKQQFQWLKQHGQRVTAQITSVKENTHVRMNYRSPMVIYATWQDPGTSKTYTFHSTNLLFDPRPRLSGPTIDVILDPRDPSKYYMDLVALSKTPPVDPYQQQRQLQTEVDQLKQQVADLQKKQSQ